MQDDEEGVSHTLRDSSRVLMVALGSVDPAAEGSPSADLSLWLCRCEHTPPVPLTPPRSGYFLVAEKMRSET